MIIKKMKRSVKSITEAQEIMKMSLLQINLKKQKQH